MERREPGLFGTLFAFGSPLLVGLLVLYEGVEAGQEAAQTLVWAKTAGSFPRPIDPAPLAMIIAGWVGFSIVLQAIAWFMNGKGSFLESLGTIGRSIGVLGLLEAVRLGAVLNGLYEWVGTAAFMVVGLVVLAWTGRAWGKLHLLSRRETVVVTLVCFYGPVLALAGVVVAPVLRIAW